MSKKRQSLLEDSFKCVAERVISEGVSVLQVSVPEEESETIIVQEPSLSHANNWPDAWTDTQQLEFQDKYPWLCATNKKLGY